MSMDPVAHLRDPDPPTPDESTLAGVQRRSRQRHRRRLGGSITVAAVTVLALSISVVVSRRDEDGVRLASEVTVTTSQVVTVTTTPTTPAAFVPTGDVARCFPEAATPVRPSSAAAGTGGDAWPDGAPPLLALTSRGQVWVLHGGRAERWTPTSGSANHRYLWARWEDAGTILASRLVDTPAVVLDRLISPGQATPVATFPYTVSTRAPGGFCPIDGYLANFAARPDGVVLAKHRAGPIPHSCPYGASPEDCTSPEGLSFEIRLTPTISQPGSDPGSFIGSNGTTLVADAERSSAFASLTGSSISVVRPDAEVACCYGGQSGSAFSLSPQGDKVAFSPDGTELRVAELGRAGEVGRPVWRASDQITATAFTSSWIAVAHGGSISLVSPDGSQHLNLATPLLEGVASLDWAA